MNVFNPLLLKTYHRIHPSRRLVVRLYDCLKGAQLSKAPKLRRMFRTLLDEGVIAGAESYFRRDAELLGILYRPNGASPEAMRRLRRDDRSCLYCFLGGGVKKGGSTSRLRDMESVKSEILSIYPRVQPWIREQLVTGGVSSQWLSYPDYVRVTSQAEVCVDLIRTSQNEGFSYRIPEALWLNQKIITNRQIVRDEPFYDPDRVFIIGLDPLTRLQSFLEKDVPPLSPGILRLYDSSLWWTEKDPYGGKI